MDRPNDAVSGGEDCVFADEAAAAKTFYLSGRTQGNETHLPRELVRLGLDAADDLAGAAVGSAASYLTWICNVKLDYIVKSDRKNNKY